MMTSAFSIVSFLSSLISVSVKGGLYSFMCETDSIVITKAESGASTNDTTRDRKKSLFIGDVLYPFQCYSARLIAVFATYLVTCYVQYQRYAKR